jgi:hypothetical protein
MELMDPETMPEFFPQFLLVALAEKEDRAGGTS